MCDTDEYAIILFRSTCLRVVKLAYTIPKIPNVNISGVKYTLASGNNGIEYLKKP